MLCKKLLFVSIILLLMSNGICYTIMELTEPSILNRKNETYVLTNNITTTHTCFVISADSITLDLNGKTIYFNPSNDSMYAISIPPFWMTRRWFPDPFVTEESFKGACYFTIKNGKIIQNSNKTCCHSIFGYQVEFGNISNIEITFSSPNSDGILFYYGGNHKIYNNIIYNNSVKVDDRHAGKESIGLLMDSGNSEIYKNKIYGGPQYGIRIIQLSENQCGQTVVFKNEIRQNAIVANPYSIGIYANNVRCYENKIRPKNGRGIHILEVKNVEIFKNNIVVKEKFNSEYTPGWSHGIKLENCLENIHIHDNIVNAVGGFGEFGHAYALDITGTNCNNIYNNIFSVYTLNSDIIAASIHLVGSHHITIGNNNICRGNGYSIHIDWDQANNIEFISSIFNNTNFIHSVRKAEFIKFIDPQIKHRNRVTGDVNPEIFYHVKFQVYEKETNYPIKDVIITVGSETCITGIDGHIMTSNLYPETPFSYKAEKIGYNTIEKFGCKSNNISLKMEKMIVHPIGE